MATPKAPSVTEIWNGRRTNVREVRTQGFASALIDNAAVTYTRVFRCLTTSSLIDAPDVLLMVDPVTGLSIPKMYDVYVAANGTTDDQAVCNVIQPEQSHDDPTVWQVRCEFSTDVPIDPLSRPVILRVSSITRKIAIYEDTNGDAILNSADDPFDPPVEIDITDIQCEFTKNYGSVDLAFIHAWTNTINSVPWFGADKHNAKIERITATEKFDWNLTYAEYVFTIVIRTYGTGWDKSVLDAGYHYLDANGKLTLARDILDQTPLHNAVLLDGEGHRNAQGASPVYIIFDAIYDEMDFNDLGLIQ